jgi:hypothetical protein
MDTIPMPTVQPDQPDLPSPFLSYQEAPIPSPGRAGFCCQLVIIEFREGTASVATVITSVQQRLQKSPHPSKVVVLRWGVASVLEAALLISLSNASYFVLNDHFVATMDLLKSIKFRWEHAVPPLGHPFPPHDLVLWTSPSHESLLLAQEGNLSTVVLGPPAVDFLVDAFLHMRPLLPEYVAHTNSALGLPVFVVKSFPEGTRTKLFEDCASVLDAVRGALAFSLLASHSCLHSLAPRAPHAHHTGRL